MEKWIAIVADDLTGANDSGVQLTEKGVPTSVLFDLPDHSQTLDQGIVIDTNGRALLREEAYKKTKEAAQFIKEAGYRTIYKKMDSTLRGHIGTELKAMKDVFQPEFVFISPAFPALHRTTKDGIHYIKDQRVSDTEISRDPKHPVKESSIPTLIENEIGEKVGLLKKSALINRETFEQIVRSFQSQGICYLVCDAETEEDLKLFSKWMLQLSSKVIWAGSAGLAEVLPDVLQLHSIPAERTITPSEQVVIVCGSLSLTTQKQVRTAAAKDDVIGVEVDTLKIFSPLWVEAKQVYLNLCKSAIEEGKHVAIYVPSNVEIREKVKQAGESLGFSSYQIGEEISTALAEIVRTLASTYHHLNSFVLTGGDTAKETAKQLGGNGIRLIKQLEPGIPVGQLIGASRPLTVVTKAGAFGDDDSIYRAACELKGDIVYE